MTESIVIEPMDPHNELLVKNTHPPDWKNPTPTERYNLVVLGGGTAGLVTAAGAAGLGAKVALVERHLLGGDCLNVGCVPSKSIIRSSRVVVDVRSAEQYGVKVPEGAEVDFPAVMERMRRLRALISHHDSVRRFQEMGVDVFLGEARFRGPYEVEVAGETLRFKKAVIATGSRPVLPPIKGLKETGYLTNETVFSLIQRPPRLGVIGAGPLACELAQAFSRLGSQVILMNRSGRIMKREDTDVAEMLQKVFIREGIRLILNCTYKRIEQRNGEKVIHFEREGKEDSVAVDEILVGTGRKPSVENLNLEAAGVEYDQRLGVHVNDRLRTTNPRIYAAGDICMKHKFTHMADAAARVVLQNALFWGRKNLSALTVPWCTYTDPEVAHVGMSEKDAQDENIPFRTFTISLSEVDRAITDSEEEGLVKIHIEKKSDKILGATIVARHAGEMISEITLAMVGRLGLGTLANVIHPYPTQAEAIKHAADAYMRSRLTPFVKKLFTRLLAWRR